MDLSFDTLFQALFNSPVPRIVVKANAPHFTIVINNDAHKVATNLVGRDITGMTIPEVFNPQEAGDGGELLMNALNEAQQSNRTVLMPPFRYDMPSPDQSTMELKWWQLEILPLGGPDGKAEYLMATTHNITEQVISRQAIEEGEKNQKLLNEELAAINKELKNLNNSLDAESRKELERAYEQIRLSKEAAQLGMFDMDLINGTMEWDARCRQLFGISHQNEVSYENDFLPGLHEDDRDRISTIISDLLSTNHNNGNYDVEYRTVGVVDKKLRWVRAKGRVFYNEYDVPTRFTGSVLDITDIKEEEQRKNEFIGMVSHELKTPLTSLKANIQMLHVRSQKMKDDFTLRALSQADKQIKRMTGMINGFLNISQLEAGSLPLKITQFDINRLILNVIEEVQLTVNTHKINFDPSATIIVSADEDKINHVLSNLISNAVKYSPQGSTIHIGAGVTESNLVVKVQDDGIGIKDQDLKHLFIKYYRADDTNNQYISGFGIGLYLCAEIIRLHKGEIWAESEVGKGATFMFTLPVGRS